VAALGLARAAHCCFEERFRAELDDVHAGVDREADPVEAVGRLGARPILQQALEDEVTEILGRPRYERTVRRSRTVMAASAARSKTTSGAVEFERPRVRPRSRRPSTSR